MKFSLYKAAFCAVGLCAQLYAQEVQIIPHFGADTIKSFKSEEVVISANKVEELSSRVAQKIAVIPAAEIRQYNSQTMADVLSNSGQVLVQKSQQGGGSPIIRGFEASRVLLMIDGVRMNNLIYRAGHLQNVITVDPNIVDRTEVTLGSGSTLYGSDALGGVISIYTQRPKFYDGEKMKVSGKGFLRYASANQEKTGHFDINFGSSKWAALTSITYSDFGDMRSGANRGNLYPDFGKRLYYVERINGKDSIIQNANPNVQVGSAYTQYGIMQKIAYRQNEHLTHDVNFQYSNSSNVPRYDRLSEYSTTPNTLKYAEWYYGPQLRVLGAYNLNGKGYAGAISNFHIGANWQKLQESRVSRRINSSKLGSRIEDVQVLGLNADFDKKLGENHSLRFGLEGQFGSLTSTAHSLNIDTQVETPLDTRYPDGDNTQLNMAAYLSDSWAVSEKITVNAGVRLSYIDLNSTFVDTTFFNLPYRSVNQTNLAPAGNLGLVFRPTDEWLIKTSLSSAFRAPNVDDLSRVFETTPGRIIVPNANISPERTYTWDASVSKTVADKVRFEIAGWYTRFSNAIVLRPFQYEGKDSILYDGTMSQVYANQNAQNAYNTGFSAAISADLTDHLFLQSQLTYTYGRILTDSTPTPIDHIPPMYGRTSLRYAKGKFEAETWALYNGWKRISDYLLGAEDNEIYATPDGMPAWYTLNLRASYNFQNKYLLQVGAENLLDRHYRVFASGFSGAGRNVYVALRASF